MTCGFLAQVYFNTSAYLSNVNFTSAAYNFTTFEQSGVVVGNLVSGTAGQNSTFTMINSYLTVKLYIGSSSSQVGCIVGQSSGSVTNVVIVTNLSMTFTVNSTSKMGVFVGGLSVSTSITANNVTFTPTAQACVKSNTTGYSKAYSGVSGCT